MIIRIPFLQLSLTHIFKKYCKFFVTVVVVVVGVVVVVRRPTYRCNPLGPNLQTPDVNCKKSHLQICSRYVFKTQGHTEVIVSNAFETV